MIEVFAGFQVIPFWCWDIASLFVSWLCFLSTANEHVCIFVFVSAYSQDMRFVKVRNFALFSAFSLLPCHSCFLHCCFQVIFWFHVFWIDQTSENQRHVCQICSSAAVLKCPSSLDNVVHCVFSQFSIANSVFRFGIQCFVQLSVLFVLLLLQVASSDQNTFIPLAKRVSGVDGSVIFAFLFLPFVSSWSCCCSSGPLTPMSVRQALENSMKQAAASSGSVLFRTLAGTYVNSLVSPYPYPLFYLSLSFSFFWVPFFVLCRSRFHIMSLWLNLRLFLFASGSTIPVTTLLSLGSMEACALALLLSGLFRWIDDLDDTHPLMHFLFLSSVLSWSLTLSVRTRWFYLRALLDLSRRSFFATIIPRAALINRPHHSAASRVYLQSSLRLCVGLYRARYCQVRRHNSLSDRSVNHLHVFSASFLLFVFLRSLLFVCFSLAGAFRPVIWWGRLCFNGLSWLGLGISSNIGVILPTIGKGPSRANIPRQSEIGK